MDFKNKVVLITGASSGIGRESATAFAKLGADIILVSRTKEKLEQVADELKKFNVTTLVCQCDVSKKDQVKEMSRIVLEKFNSVDILVNNAGFAIYGSVSDLSIDDIESQMETNYFGMVYCTKYFLPSMLDKKSGHIVNVASVAASFGLPGIAPYCASKFAMLGFSEGLKHELKNSGVGITVVSPIMVRTNFFEHPSFEKMPKFSPTSLSSKTVAKAILRAANSQRLEIIVPSLVRAAVWMKNTFPYFINPILGMAFKKQPGSAKKD
ncbi:MAG: SDR family NAD(P)-dependent oxidoreductase [Nitrosopumilus sp.]|nr:SDR family NAD(P)-dependent oxidoreductase [Nitrosopumilus sp.]MDF2423304.1 SDR family NAD(P)-dependent oxidoreductase [Nitrosopumilus sp.]MDF2424514.1 SDR family NAD(P)-dependent oxidoreductase [Nitrosopumilus sp.]MDF2425217.1 SDR family NAD(P)-dependent oxidoreductase [Nitrosopumilus sp.]MDF2426893.1 SDR family NAD(P)-dependent oxidoreductase [Nitrosopumilus sp.]